MDEQPRAFVLYDPQTGAILQVSRQFIAPADDVLALHNGAAFIEIDPLAAGDMQGKRVTDGELVADPDWAPPVIDPLEGPRHQRNALLRDSAWTQQVDAPLTPACIEAYRAWRVCLHRWLVDHPDGQTPLPEAPTLDYLALDQQV